MTSAAFAQPLALPSETIPNRIAKAAMTEGLADTQGRASEGLVRLYNAWARGGAGLLITGNVQIDAHHLERPGNVVIAGAQAVAHMAERVTGHSDRDQAVGHTIAEAFNAMHRLELSCKTQLAAMACNEKIRQVPPDVIEKTYLNYQPTVRRPFGVLEWPALLRKLDRMDPSYRE